MAKDYFVPKTDQGKADWLDNLAVKIGGYAVTLGLAPAEITSAVWDYKAVYRLGDDHVGQFSEPIQVTVTRKTGY